MSNINLSVLPFDTSAQLAVVGHMLNNDEFFLQCIDKVESSWFVDKQVADVYKHIKSLSKDMLNGRRVTPSEVKNHIVNDRSLTSADVRAIVDKTENERQKNGLDYIQNQMTHWYKSRIFHESLTESAKLYNAGQFDACFALINQHIKTLDEATFIPALAVDASDFLKAAEEDKINLTNAMTFGLSMVDKCLVDNPHANGSLLPGDTTVLMAGVNAGKSSCLITVIAHNMIAGKKILYTIHEGRENDIVMKLWSCLLGKTRTQILDMYLHPTPFDKQIIEHTSKLIKENLTYIPIIKAGNTIEDVTSVIRLENKKLKDRTGKGYDMWVCDYPANLTTNQAQKGMAKRERDDVVYGYVVDLAGELKLHALCAIQTNREGYKQNKNTDDDATLLLGLDMVSESFGPMMRATNVISLNKSDSAEKNNYLIYYICKSRSNSVNWAIAAKSAFEYCKTHSNSLGGFYYKGSAAMPEKIEAFLQQNKEKLKDGVEVNSLELFK